MSGFVIAGTHSGVGKTTVSFALMAQLLEAGFSVQPFKLGPDFIDPGYHRLATGRDSINLDFWMMGRDGVAGSFERYARTADVAVVEGMGGLHDGENGTARGSAAHIARSLGLPVLLVVDIWGMTRSTVAVVRGYEQFDARVEIAALILNRAGSRRHFEMVRDALPPDLRRRLVGYLPADDGLSISERHLGLVTLEENPQACTLRNESLARARDTLDLSRVIEIFGIERRSRPTEERIERRDSRIRIGIARDPAFCFYYPENLWLLEAAGAELVPFSPINDRKLPGRIAGIYLGGGYPESFSEELAANTEMKREIRDVAERGGPVYAECGGMMYLSQELVGFDGRSHSMVGLLPLGVVMDRSHLSIRYVEIKTTRESLLGPAGTRARGQEFHQSRLKGSAPPELDGCYQLRDSGGATSIEGFAKGNILASYVHLHFGSNPRISKSFVRLCSTFARRQP